MLKRECSTGNFPDCSDAKSVSAQWGKTDTVTYIELRLRFHVIFSVDLNEIMVNRASRKMQVVKSHIKTHLCKNYVCQNNLKTNTVITILGKPKNR